MRQLRRLDRLRGWEDNWTAYAITAWCSPPRHRGFDGYPHPEPWHGDDDWWADCDNPRTVIEIALNRMSKKARRELRRLVLPADERRRTRLLTNPFAHVDLPWWLRTFGDYH